MRGYVRFGSCWIALLACLLTIGAVGCSSSGIEQEKIEQQKKAAEFGDEGRVVALYVYRFYSDTAAVLENSRGDRIIVRIDDKLVATGDTWKLDWSSHNYPVLADRVY